MKNLFQAYAFGYNNGYGIGFGAPYLLPTYIGSCSQDCSSRDFVAELTRYGIQV